jgi:hypothetical protein
LIKRYGDEALAESASRADELASAGNDAAPRSGAVSWRR